MKNKVRERETEWVTNKKCRGSIVSLMCALSGRSSSGGDEQRRKRRAKRDIRDWKERMINNFNGFLPILLLIQCHWHYKRVRARQRYSRQNFYVHKRSINTPSKSLFSFFLSHSRDAIQLTLCAEETVDARKKTFFSCCKIIFRLCLNNLFRCWRVNNMSSCPHRENGGFVLLNIHV